MDMANTPKVSRKPRLSFNRNRLSRQNASPQQLRKSAEDIKYGMEITRSPSISRSTGGFENLDGTPPHKRFNLDDSLDFSPKNFDMSFSPNHLLSQTLLVDSPEVDWRWGQRLTDGDINMKASTLNSGSNKTPVLKNNEKNHRRRFSIELRREEQRTAIELEWRRREKTRENEALQKRVAKFQEKLKKTESQMVLNNSKIKEAEIIEKVTEIDDTVQNSSNTEAFIDTMYSDINFSVNDSINDFFNDSDTDGLLLAATQQIETEMSDKPKPMATRSPPLTHKKRLHPTTPTRSSTSLSPKPFLIDRTAQTKQMKNILETPENSKSAEKRSSFYLQFLEDETPDDFFTSLDDVISQAMEAKKPRTSFYRYNSMPAEVPKTTTITSTSKPTVTATTTTNAMQENNETGHLKIKRHASSHAISPVSSNYRRHHLQLRK